MSHGCDKHECDSHGWHLFPQKSIRALLWVPKKWPSNCRLQFPDLQALKWQLFKKTGSLGNSLLRQISSHGTLHAITRHGCALRTRL